MRPKDVFPGLEAHICNLDRDLGAEEVGVFAFCGISRGDHYNAGDEFAVTVGNSRGGSHFSLNAFIDHVCAGWYYGNKLFLCRLPPASSPRQAWAHRRKRQDRQGCTYIPAQKGIDTEHSVYILLCRQQLPALCCVKTNRADRLLFP